MYIFRLSLLKIGLSMKLLMIYFESITDCLLRSEEYVYSIWSRQAIQNVHWNPE